MSSYVIDFIVVVYCALLIVVIMVYDQKYLHTRLSASLHQLIRFFIASENHNIN